MFNKSFLYLNYMQGRALFLRVGRMSVRAPIVGATLKGDEKIPPADVPEYELFSMLQAQRRGLVNYLER